MDENDIIKQNEVYVVSEQEDITMAETIDVIEVNDMSQYTADSFDAFPAIGESNEYLKHSLLNGRELHDQHPITAITGLRDELDSIEALQPIYSNEKQTANYYLWEDENPLQEDRNGYFVSLCEDIRTIKICASGEIFGVTVDKAAFIGGQDDIARDHKYGMVAHTGIADVRCELDVNVGDFVVSNDYGMAAKSNSNYGYEVIALNTDGDVQYATVSLDISAKQMNTMGQELIDLDDRMYIAEKNIIAAINVANEAYNKADNMDFEGLSKEIEDKVNDAVDKADEALTNSENSNIGVQEAIKMSQEAMAIANSMMVTAESIRKEAVNKANETEASVNDLIKELEPLTTWDENGNYSGASYLAEYIHDGVATKAEIETAENLIQRNTSSIETSAKRLQTFVSTIDKYCVGKVSQAYGLTKSQAESILEQGMIYVPIETEGVDGVPTKYHFETYDDKESPITQEFLTTCYYTWNGTHWIGSEPNVVAFSRFTPAVGDNFQYWYTGEEIDDEAINNGYETQTLYLWDNWGDEENPNYYWMAVDTLKDNARVNSMITQTANSIASEITNGQGGVNSIRQYLSDYESKTTDLNQWKTYLADENGNLKSVGTIAAIEKKVSEDGARIDLVVTQTNDGNNVVNAAGIVTAINKSGDSSIKLIADHIKVDGAFTANGNAGFTTDGNLFARGGTIGGWTIGSGLYCGYIHLNPSFPDGGGPRDGICVDPELGIYFRKSLYDEYGNFIGNTDPFVVTKSGTLTATDAYITGQINAHGFNARAVNSPFHMELDSNSLKFYHTDGSTPKISMSYSNVQKLVQLVLGAGTTDDDYTGRFFIEKYDTSAKLSYATGQNVGNYIEITGSKINLSAQRGASEIYLDAATMKYNGNSFMLNSGTWTSSDLNLKNSISELSDEYNVLFDAIAPKTYKYNNGASGRYHTGFIAQNIKDSIDTAGLTTQDFAAYGVDEDTGNCMLRYEEFIALNTWQIQKAKARITELEEKVAELEELIKE